MFEKRSWSTDGLVGGKKQQYWQQVVNEAVFNLDIKLDTLNDFNGLIDLVELGPISMSHIQVQGWQTVKRTRSAIAKSDRGQFEFVVMQEGQVLLEHCGREITLQAGDSLLIDGRQPYTLTTGIPRSGNLSFHLPVNWLETWLPQPDRMAGIAIRGSSRWGKAISELASAIQGDAEEQASLNFNLCADQLAGMIALALRSSSDAHQSQSRQCGIVSSAKELLCQQAHDREMTASHLASLLGISVRYLHKVFAAEETSYSKELYEARLSLAMRMLKNRDCAELSIAEISWRSGFSDPSHFFRRFKRQYGCVPSKLRQY